MDGWECLPEKVQELEHARLREALERCVVDVLHAEFYRVTLEPLEIVDWKRKVR